MSKRNGHAEKCIAPGCNKPVRSRGLCATCYHAARKLVVSKEVAGWDWLVAKGLAIGKTKLAKSKSPLASAIRKTIRAAKPPRTRRRSSKRAGGRAGEKK